MLLQLVSNKATLTGMPHAPDDQLADLLRRVGLRVTSQRLVLHRALRELDRHVTAEEVAAAAADRLPGLALPTVYATLDLFAQLGLVRRVAAGSGAALYDPRTDEHAHLVCDSCGAVSDVDVRLDLRPATRAAARDGAAVHAAEVVLQGRCPACLRSAAAPAAAAP
jgi:Fe2+ or Zn2+ uptake regulation protein